MAFSTKEKLALREAIHAMKWLDKHHDGWGLEEECAILENICNNYKEKEIQSNHNYLDFDLRGRHPRVHCGYKAQIKEAQP